MRNIQSWWLINERSGSGFWGWLLAVIVPLLITAAAIRFGGLVEAEYGVGIIFVSVGLAGIACFTVLHNERIWIFSAVAAHALYLASGQVDTVSISEVAYSAIVIVGTAIWFAKEFVARRAVVRTGFDVLLLMFIVLSTLITLLMTAMHGGDAMFYLKEWTIMAELLFYFPLRSVINSKRDIKILIILFVVVASLNGVLAISTYRERLAEAVYQWQLKARSNVNEPTSMGLLIMSAAIWATARKFSMKLIGLVGTVAGVVLLLITYSRSPIISGVFGVALMAAMLPWRNARRVVLAFFLSLGLGAGVLFVVYPGIASFITGAIGTRLMSVASASTDLSLRSRIVETETLINEYIAISPVLGYGYGVTFTFYNVLTDSDVPAIFVHNGYVWAAFKYGIPIALLLMGVIAYPLIRLLLRHPGRHEGFERTVMATTVGYLLCVMLMNMTSTLFTGVSALFNFTICWALLDWVDRGMAMRPLPPPLPGTSDRLLALPTESDEFTSAGRS